MKLYTSKVGAEKVEKKKRVRKIKIKQEPTPEVESVDESVTSVEPEVKQTEVKEEPVIETVKTIEEPVQVEEVKEEVKQTKKIETDSDSIVEVKKKRNREPVEPPKWFKTFIANTRMNEQKTTKPKVEKKPKKEIKKEAVEYARDQWQDRFVRDRFTNQGEKHLDQLNHLYGQIFKR